MVPLPVCSLLRCFLGRTAAAASIGRSPCSPFWPAPHTLLAPCALCTAAPRPCTAADIAASGRSRFFSSLPPQVVEHLQTRPYAMENHAHGRCRASHSRWAFSLSSRAPHQLQQRHAAIPRPGPSPAPQPACAPAGLAWTAVEENPRMKEFFDVLSLSVDRVGQVGDGSGSGGQGRAGEGMLHASWWKTCRAGGWQICWDCADDAAKGGSVLCARPSLLPLTPSPHSPAGVREHDGGQALPHLSHAVVRWQARQGAVVARRTPTALA